jgi:hypothetical protein
MSWLYRARNFVQMARRLLKQPGVSGPQMAGQGRRKQTQTETRCVMEALALIIFVVTFAGGGGGKAGW